MRSVGAPIVVEDAINRVIATTFSSYRYSEEAMKLFIDVIKEVKKDYYPRQYTWEDMIDDFFPGDNFEDVPEDYHKIREEIQKELVEDKRVPVFLIRNDRNKDMVLYYLVMTTLQMAEDVRVLENEGNLNLEGGFSDTVEKRHMRYAMIKHGLYNYFDDGDEEDEDEEEED